MCIISISNGWADIDHSRWQWVGRHELIPLLMGGPIWIILVTDGWADMN